MKKVTAMVLLAILLAGGAVGAMPAFSQAQAYYPPPPPNPYASPWVGPRTPWVYYNNDWFLNGILYYNFGPRYGWAPYYSYPQTYVMRPGNWYGPRWHDWYRGHPAYWNDFHRRYPYWRGHREGRHYDEAFYNRYHHGQGGGWHHGYHGEH